MRRHTLFWKLFGSLVLLVLVVQGLSALYVAGLHRRFVAAEQESHLDVLARLVAERVAPLLGPGDSDALRRQCAGFDADAQARVTVILPSGEVVADSRQDPAVMESHAGRPEVRDALAGRVGFARRFSTTKQMTMTYVALPIVSNDTVRGVVRVAVPERSNQSLLGSLQRRLLIANAVLLALAAGLSYLVSRSVSRPLEALRRSADALTHGMLTVAWPAPTTREAGALADAMRNMARTLQEKISTIERLLDEQRAIFDNMVDGVFVVDREDRVVALNRAAAKLLGIDAATAQGRGVLEVARNARLAELVSLSQQAEGPVEGDLTLYGDGERYLQVHGISLKDGQRHAGALLVLTDVTRLRELETLRRDFVANASHELKTPVTAIKGFADTLVAGDIDPDQTRRFTKIIARQADQLVALVDDLLELTRLEHEGERRPIEKEDIELAPVVWSAVGLCTDEARQKDIKLTVRCPETVHVSVNETLIQRALVNLVDNAVKYSGPRTEVQVDVEQDEQGTRIAVRDQGCGIPAEHLARIFERFYRVDKSRSRKLGGTGLGLSIVKHVAQAHGGEIAVDSTPGKGSVFTLVLPAQPTRGS